MIPRTEEELELYFLLIDLNEAREVASRSIWQHGTPTMQRMAEEKYWELKQEYLKKANEANFSRKD